MPSRKPVELLYEPDPSKACEEIKKSLLYRHSLIVIGSFSIRKDGQPYLANGERILLIKSDWSIIVQRDNFSTQAVISWDTCDSVKVLCGDVVSVVAEKEEADESGARGGNGILERLHSLEFDFNRVYAVVSTNLVDGTLLLEPGDGELLTAVLLKPELIETGFKPLPSNEELKSGFVDLIGIDSRGQKTVVLLTKKEATSKNVSELSRFIASVRRHVSEGEEVRGILAAPSISPSALAKLRDYNFEFKRIDLDEVSEIISYYRSEIGERIG
ncbi:MAG: endonuclease NucS domain-containing protein [Thermoprotei archaeon]